jgi:GTP-binding protein
MVKYLFKNAKFIKTVLEQKEYPLLTGLKGQEMLEIAVAGRSNVGKSTLLNHLFQRKGLVKTSSRPGKTQALNYFTVDDDLALVDLPGYGYAKVPLSVRRKWGPMVQTYLDNRDLLKIVLFLFDIRRMPNGDDFQMMDWLLQSEKAVILVITKVDKVKRNEKKAKTQKILETFNVANLHHVHYSATKNVGRKELICMINDAMLGEDV